MTALVVQGDARRLPLPDGCVDLIITSPPYFALRSYTDAGTHYKGQIGSEATPTEYLDALWARRADGDVRMSIVAPYIGTRPSSWRIDLPCGPLLTENHRIHHMRRYRIQFQLRAEAMLLAKKAKIPPMERVHVYGLVIPPDRIKRDPSNWLPSFKAAIDGLVDAGVVPDDDAAHLTGPDMRLADVLRCRWERHCHIALEIRED